MAFIVFEGLDGSGKSTLIQSLSEQIKDQGKEFVVTREPGGTELGEDIRHLLLRIKGQAPVPRAELLLYEAGRAQLVDTLVRPALAEHKWVLCDRYYGSTLAFQAGGRGLPEKPIHWLNDYATEGLVPDLWVLLDLPVEESENRRLRRFAEKGEQADRFEREEKEFHQKVRDYYLKLATADPENWLVLDAREPPESLQEQLMEEVRRRQWLSS